MTAPRRFFEYRDKTTGEVFEELGLLSDPLRGKNDNWELIREVPNLFGGTGIARMGDPSLSTKRGQHFYDTVVHPMKKIHKGIV